MSYELPELIESRELVTTRMPRLQELEDSLRREGPPRERGIILAVADPRAYYVTQELERFDREFRRTSSRARSGALPLSEALSESVAASRRSGELRVWTGDRSDPASYQREKQLRGSLHGTRPDNPVQSSLGLVAWEPGSSLMLLEALGAAVTVMASEPMTALANAAAWSGPVRFIHAFLGRRADPLAGVSARQALTVLSEFCGKGAR